MYGDNNYGMI